MHHKAIDDFDHPKLTDESPLRRHVLYRLEQKEYLAKIDLTEYKAHWKNLFVQLKEKLQSLGKEIFVDIEHIGSTAIEAMKAKDIVDVQCSVRSFDEIQLLKPKLELLGFEMIETINQDHVPFHDMDYFSPLWATLWTHLCVKTNHSIKL